MSQVSYGTITITDTNDIERIYVVYAKSTTNTDAPTAAANTWTESISTAPGTGDYIWQRTVTEKSGVTELVYGNPICVTGPRGGTGNPGQSIDSIVTTYCNYGDGTPVASYSGWQTNVPAYDSSKPNYWIKTVVNYINPTESETTIRKDEAITSANQVAATANSIAQHAQEDAEGALAQAAEANQTANRVEALLDGHFIYGGALSQLTPGGARVVEQVKESGTDVSDNPTKWHHNVTIGSNGIALRYNEAVMAQMAANQGSNNTALRFYQPPTVSGNTTTQGALAMELSGSALKFYDATGTVAQAEFGGNQATISGTINVYDGKIGNSENSYWYIGNYLDYNQNNSAAIKSHGTAFIQLGDSSTWRVATNRIHGAWNNDSGTGDAFRLHFPIYNDKNSVSKYWDVGMHLPLARTDKFLYIRNASSNQSLENLGNDLEDSGYDYWTYQFWVDGEGNITTLGAIDAHSISIDGVPMSGGSLVAGSLASYGGTSNRPVYFPSSGDNQGKPVQITITDNDSATAVSSSDTNLITARTLYYAGYTKNTGTVTSVGISNATNGGLSISGSPITTNGTITIGLASAYGDTKNPYGTKTKNYVLAGPTTGSAAAPTFRALVAADIPDLSSIYLTAESDPTVPAWAKAANKPTYALSELNNAQDVQAIEALTGTSGLLRKTAANTWSLDTNTYLTSYTESDPIFTASAAYNITSTDINNWNNNVGAVTSVATGVGLTGGTITSTGTIKANLTSDTKLSNAALSVSEDANRIYPVRIDKNSKMVVVVPWTNINSSYLTGITSSDIISALGYTPYNSTNPNGYTTNTGTVTSVKVQGSNGLTGSGTVTTNGTITLSHDDTSSQASSSNSGRTYIQSVTLDDYGHVTGLSTATETVTDTHYTAYLYAGASNGNTNATTTNGNTYLILVDGGSVTARRKIAGSGTVEVKSDNNGNITITGSAHPTTLPNPNALTLNLFNETTARATGTDIPTSSISYNGGTANISFSAAGKNAITHIGISGSTLSWVRADGTSGSSEVTITAEIASGTIKLTDSEGTGIDVGSASTPVYFDDGVPVALTSATKIDYSLLPTGTIANTVAIGNHTHPISLASDTGTSGVVSLSHGGKYKLTAGGNSVIFTLPSDNNTDTKVKLTSQSTSGTYPLVFGPTSISSGTTYEAFYNTNISVNPNTKTIIATTFDGNATSATSATTASKLGSSTLGSTTKPIYLNSGTATECSTYAGGTAVTLNGTSKAASTASFYAPTEAGTTDYILASSGTGAPKWIAQSSITSGNSDEKLKIAAVTSGTTYYPIVAANSTAAATRQYDSTGIAYTGTNGTANGSNGNALLTLGNSTASTTANWKKGTVRLYGTTAYYTDLISGAPSANRTITFPNKTGTVALSGDTTSSSTTGVTISDHTTNTITGVSGSTTASYVTVGSHATDYGVKTAGSFTQGTDSFTPNTPTVINTSKFNGGSYSHTGFSGGSFTRGTFSQGTLPSLSMSVTGSQLIITFGQGTLPTHAADTFTAAVYGTDSFTAASLSSGFYTAGTAASFTQGTDSFTAPTLGSKIPTVSSSDVTVPKAASAITVVTSKTHVVNDSGHTHTI